MFDVVGLQVVHVRASLGRAVVKVVVDHVVDDVATEPSDEHAYPEDVRQRLAKDDVETSDH